MVTLDLTDARILSLVQDNADLSLADIAEAVNLSSNACWKRLKRLEEAKVIRAKVTLVDPAKVGLGLTVFVGIKAGEHSAEWYDRFVRGVANIPQVVEFYRMTGDLDYLIKVLVSDVADYDAVYKRLISIARMEDVSAAFAMETIKHTTAVPVRAG